MLRNDILMSKKTERVCGTILISLGGSGMLFVVACISAPVAEAPVVPPPAFSALATRVPTVLESEDEENNCIGPGTVKLWSVPTGADLALDGVRLGKAPLVLDGIAAGRHKIVATLSTYTQVERWVEVDPSCGATAEIRFEQLLEPSRERNLEPEDPCAPGAMILPFEAAAPANWGKWVLNTDLRDKYCNDVAIVELRTKVEKTETGDLSVTFKATTFTRPGRDKEVTIRIEIVRDNLLVGSTTISAIDAEEKKNGHGSVVLSVGIDKVNGPTPPLIRISQRAVDG
jgi:hypothetical protein